MDARTRIETDLHERFGDAVLAEQETRDDVPTLWIARERIVEALRYLKNEVAAPYRMLYDLTAIDERTRGNRQGQPAADFTVVYQLLSFERNADVRLKVPLAGERPSVPTATGVWPAANWYECEVWDMFGIAFDGHPHL
ncbi:MAG TPA: NADH-quinone oxidoreductase subunit C, partial [Ramlibacter sp.]|nr:NADH-quinone oxidoreductase subunit C [Ramlibacter sp.]